MSIVYHESSKIFHLYNQTISYIMMVLPNGHMGQLYYGKKIRDKEDFSYLLELAPRDMASYLYENDRTFSLGHIKLEYGTYGSGDYRHPAVEILQNDGSTYSDFQFTGYQVTSGKPKLPGLPATYTEQDGEAETLIITLKDTHTNLELHLLYTIFVEGGVMPEVLLFPIRETFLYRFRPRGVFAWIFLTTIMSGCSFLGHGRESAHSTHAGLSMAFRRLTAPGDILPMSRIRSLF